MNNIDNETLYLFNRLYDVDLSDEEDEALLDRAHQQVIDYGWDKTFESWKQYLFTKCLTPESVINFAHLFWCYDGCEYVIPDPYNFLGYMYYRIDMNTTKYDEMDILDGIATTILPMAGYGKADLMNDPYYSPLDDEQIIAEVEKFKSSKE